MDSPHGLTGAEPSPEQLLRSAVVALDIADPRGPRLGTGFLVAPRTVVTCAHVLADRREELPESVSGKLPGRAEPVELVPLPAWFFGAAAGGLDLAFLWAPEELDVLHAALSPVVQIGDRLLTYGHPAGLFRGGQSATFHYEGPSRLVAEGVEWEPQRVYGTPVPPGYSGSPLLNQRTGAVCGMLCLSNDRGSAHLVAASDILHHLPDDGIDRQPPEVANARWLAALTDDQIRAGGWRFPGPRLREYLRTAVRSARHSTYPGSETGAGSPELPTVYVDQNAIRTDPPYETRSVVPALEMSERAEHAIVFGGPGMGKSSLLRMCLLNLAQGWLSGRAGPAVPVWVQGADLVGAKPLPELIAASVEANLSAVGLVDAWPLEFFRDEPLQGTRWLVLVDGLDDIVDAESRRKVLAKLAGVAGGPACPYRFVIASRPLSTGELSDEDEWLSTRYELRPFGVEQLRTFAGRLLDSLGQGLVEELDRTHLTGIAGIPLLATMLCQVRAMAPDRPLPTSLIGIYQDFVDVLGSPQFVADSRGIYAQTEIAFRPYGGAAVRATADVLERAPDLLTRLALARRDGATDPALDLIAGWESDSRPKQVPEKRWQHFLNGILRRSGLLTERHGDFLFVHETIGDFLAARAVTADESRSFAAFNELFYQCHRPWPGVGATWRQPGWSYSYSRFLIAQWPETRTVRAIRHVAENGGLPGCDFVASLFADGIVADPDVVAITCAMLARTATTSVGHGFAARRALGLLARLEAHDWLVKVMTSENAGKEIRGRAAIALAEFGDARGADRLTAIVTDADGDAHERFTAYLALASLGDGRADGLLPLAFHSLAEARGGRSACDHLLTLLGEARGADLLAEIVDCEALLPDLRDAAAYALERRGDKRCWPRLAAKATRNPTTYDKRLAGLALLARLKDPRALERLWFIAENSLLSGQVRLAALEILRRQGESRVADVLGSLVANSGLDFGSRQRGVAILAEMGGKQSLQRLAGSQALDYQNRAVAVRSLIDTASEGDADQLLSFAADATLRPGLRAAAAEILELFRHQGVSDVWLAIAEDGSIERRYRADAARRALALGHPRAPGIVEAIDSEVVMLPPQGPSEARYNARSVLFTGLVRCQDPTGAHPSVNPGCLDVLASFVDDTAVGREVRRIVARVLVDFGDPRGKRSVPHIWDGREGELRNGTVDVCLALVRYGGSAPLDWLRSIVSHPETGFVLCRYAAETLARLGDGLGNETLVKFLSMPELSAENRCKAAASLGRSDDSRGVNFLRDLAVNEGMRSSVRHYAATWLYWLGDPSGKNLVQMTRTIPDDAVGPALTADPGQDLFADLDLALMAFAHFEDAATRTDLDTRILTRSIFAMHSDPTAVRTLLATATGQEFGFDQRRGAILSLAAHGASDELVQIAEEPECGATVRCWAAEEAAALGDLRGLEVLVELIGSRTVDPYTRRRAAQRLVQFGDPRGTELLVDLATDPSTTVDARRTTTQLLTQLTDYADALVTLILNQATSESARGHAIDILAGQGELDVLARLRAEPMLPHDARHRAAQAVQRSHQIGFRPLQQS